MVLQCGQNLIFHNIVIKSVKMDKGGGGKLFDTVLGISGVDLMNN